MSFTVKLELSSPSQVQGNDNAGEGVLQGRTVERGPVGNPVNADQFNGNIHQSSSEEDLDDIFDGLNRHDFAERFRGHIQKQTLNNGRFAAERLNSK